jgi:hypothetical protein
VRFVLVAGGRQFDLDEGGKGEDPHGVREFGTRDVGIRNRLVRPDFLTGEDEMDRVAGFVILAVEEKIEVGSMPIGESGLTERGLDRFEVRTTDEEINVARRTRCRLIDLTDPRRDGMAPATAYSIPARPSAAVARSRRSLTFSTARSIRSSVKAYNFAPGSSNGGRGFMGDRPEPRGRAFETPA